MDYRAYVEYLQHHGIKGQHWGVRRYQNEDGSLTEAGKKRYHVEYDSWTGQTKVVDQQGKKISGSEKTFFETQMKERARNDQDFNKKYIAYKQTSDSVRNSNIHDHLLAMYGPRNIADVALYNATHDDRSRREAARQGKQAVDDILADFANSYLDDVEKQLRKK